ncbi:response regulator transcription factor [Colwellia sp. 6_MG-2023]|uniref:response regulator transcription factor n=1 Tax=Colwellia sp. 6_MG-2023 TaxID=3062676 RepID=UPI0026E47039|nr:response regulator transcription factor [Colwellia sp. 6_MG-2023]MDO6487655.1 response regulator transcription factor [Colwellia sp. 6_MG-2023]
MNILLVEDSDKLRRSLRIGLVALGFAVDEAGDGADALAMALSDDYDIIILDLMLPSVDGLSILKSLRKHKKQSKVLILSAKDQLSDRIDGLFTGADDYMTKPFSFDELHARIIALTRRGELLRTSNTITIDDFVVDLQAKVLSFSGKAIDLTPTEYKITECLFINKEKVVSAEKMGEYIVGKYDAINKNSLEAHISSIRKKLKKFSAVFPVKNKRGFGYVATNA